jgi:peptidyl-prolyl cis-trans isomerase C
MSKKQKTNPKTEDTSKLDFGYWILDFKYLRIFAMLSCLLSIHFTPHAQSVDEIKKTLDTTMNPIGYVKFALKKKYTIDTVSIFSSSSFMGMTDSLAYYGKEGSVYGPFPQKKKKYIIKILGKAPNVFYHISHIQLDTFLFRPQFADSISDVIIEKIKTGKASFASMATLYSSDQYSASRGGNLGWLARGAMLPELNKAISIHKKGDVFKVWTPGGVHIVTITDDPKKDVGFALILKVWL